MEKVDYILVVNAKKSKTNLEGRDEGKQFDELVASIKEKGVLVPVLAREMKTAEGYKYFEVIAGNRRLAAARVAGLAKIPAQIVKMNDTEAHEAQIVENLQREGVHPLDEGKQYRELIEESKQEIGAVAQKVGKHESYIKQRLCLTNLNEKAGKAYRGGKINDGHAVLIAKLAESDQDKALKEVNSGWQQMKATELKKWIQENIYSQLKNQPWMSSKELIKAVGECVECDPVKSSLFGKVKEGECTSLKCWSRKINKYIEHFCKTENRVKVSSEYGLVEKGIKSKNDYVIVKKDKCEKMRGAIVAQGYGLGKKLSICFDKECKVHGKSQSNGYKLTPKEIAKRKEDKKIEKENNLKEKEEREKKIKKALEKIKWPIVRLDALLALVLETVGHNAIMSIVKRHELKVEKIKEEWGATRYDYSGALAKMVEGLNNDEKTKLIFELLIDTGYGDVRKGIDKI